MIHRFFFENVKEISQSSANFLSNSLFFRANVDEISSEFREHAPKYPNSLRISANVQNFGKLQFNFCEISEIDQKIQSENSMIQFTP